MRRAVVSRKSMYASLFMESMGKGKRKFYAQSAWCVLVTQMQGRTFYCIEESYACDAQCWLCALHMPCHACCSLTTRIPIISKMGLEPRNYTLISLPLTLHEVPK